MASRCSKPSTQEALLPLLASTQEALQSVVSFKDSESRTKEGRAWGNHLTAVGEGASAWGWVAVEPTPAPFVGDMKEGAQFYTNRVIKEFKDKDEKQVAWSKSYVGLLDALAKYVKQWHTTGVAWNPKGGDAASYQGGAGSSGVAAAGGAPPPPPPPPPPAAEQEATPTARSAPAAGPGAFLAQLNQGEGVTAGLKKVDPSQQTHKNPSLRGGSVVQEKRESSDVSVSRIATVLYLTPAPRSISPGQANQTPISNDNDDDDQETRQNRARWHQVGRRVSRGQQCDRHRSNRNQPDGASVWLQEQRHSGQG